jgi:hypothetical protein
MSASVTGIAAPAKRQLTIKLVLDPASSINGFNFSFASMLLAKLNKLIQEEKFLSGPPCNHGGGSGNDVVPDSYRQGGLVPSCTTNPLYAFS